MNWPATSRQLERRHKQAQFRDGEKRLDNFDFQFNARMNRSLIFDIAALGQLAYACRRDLLRLREIELFQRLQAWQVRIANAVVDGVPVALFALHRQQRFQIAGVAVVLLHRLPGQRLKVGAHGRQSRRLAVLANAGMFQGLRLVFHWMTPVVLVSNRS
jgi:hypothetical protein